MTRKWPQSQRQRATGPSTSGSPATYPHAAHQARAGNETPPRWDSTSEAQQECMSPNVPQEEAK